jgi:hypothetical protein
MHFCECPCVCVCLPAQKEWNTCSFFDLQRILCDYNFHIYWIIFFSFLPSVNHSTFRILGWNLFFMFLFSRMLDLFTTMGLCCSWMEWRRMRENCFLIRAIAACVSISISIYKIIISMHLLCAELTGYMLQALTYTILSIQILNFLQFRSLVCTYTHTIIYTRSRKIFVSLFSCMYDFQ